MQIPGNTWIAGSTGATSGPEVVFPGFSNPPSQISFVGRVIWGPQGVTINIVEIYNTGGRTEVTTQGPHGLSPGMSFVIVASDNPNFNGTWMVETVTGSSGLTFLQAPPVPAASNQEGPIYQDGGLADPTLPLVGGPIKFPGPYCFLHVHYSYIQQLFRQSPMDPRGNYLINPSTVLKQLFISRSAQADVCILVNQDQVYRMLLRYLPAFPVDQRSGPYAFWPPSIRLSFLAAPRLI
jgi:hypothetical protein